MMNNVGILAEKARMRAMSRLLEIGTEALERERAELMAMPCSTITEAMAVLRKMSLMLSRYGQEACTGLLGPEG